MKGSKRRHRVNFANTNLLATCYIFTHFQEPCLSAVAHADDVADIAALMLPLSNQVLQNGGRTTCDEVKRQGNGYKILAKFRRG
jgi:hypothetical protein